MNILGIDYGNKKIGVAIATSYLAEPLMVIRFEDMPWLINEIKQIVNQEKIQKIIVGISEGKSKDIALSFAKSLKEIGVEIDVWDETLTTKEAQLKAQEAGIKRNKRKSMEDSYAATLMLQSWLDQNI